MIMRSEVRGLGLRLAVRTKVWNFRVPKSGTVSQVTIFRSRTEVKVVNEVKVRSVVQV